MSSSTRSILLVEDQTNMRIGLAELLVREGYRVETAADGQHALDLLEAGLTPDLMLVDLSLPRVNGFELLRYAHDDPKLRVVPAVVLTALPLEEIKTAADEILSKPVDVRRLLNCLERLIGRG